MKATKRNLAVSLIALAAQGALAAMAVMPMSAFADGQEDVDALTKPINFVEMGLANTARGSYKYGEYSGLGLHPSGADILGNFSVRGGDSYGMQDGLMRWDIEGTDLGLTSRALGATASEQGNWSLGINYDELRHYITDSYQTPFQGAMGGNNFVLPRAFGVINTQTKPAAVGGIIHPYGTQALTPNQQSYFNTTDVSSGRQNTTLSASHNLDREWNFRFDFNHLAQDGAKLISAGSDSNIPMAGYNVRGEAIMMLMNPTNYTTDTVNMALNWVGDKGHATASYHGSLFQNAYNSVNFSNPYVGNATAPATNPVTGSAPGVAFPTDTLSTPPDNQFHQLNLLGGYNFSPLTKLAGGFSYGRNTQNDGYVNANQMQAGGLPQSSLNGLVIITHGDLKLTNQTTKDLTLNVGVKFNERDNRTSTNIYKFNDIGGGPETAVNTPLSNSKMQFDVAGDYRIDRRQNLNLGYEFEQVRRWCNSSLSNDGQGPGPGGPSVAASAYYSAASCIQVPETQENKLLGTYKFKATENLSLNLGYAYSNRTATVNSSFYNPMQAKSEGYELPGYMAYFDASRTEQMFKAGLNWQTTEKLTVSLNGRYTYDDYYDSALGVQNGFTWSTNLDTTYSMTDKSSVSAYMTVQKRQRELLNAAWSHTTATYFAPQTQTWSNNLDNNDYTAGLNLKQGGLMGGKLNLAGDLTYSLGQSTYSTALNYANTSCTAPSNSGYSCGTLPDISSRLLQLKLTGDYALDRSSKVIMGFIYQRLDSNDYYYNAYQMGYTPTSMMPTNQQPPSYSASTVFMVYNYSFR